MIPTIQYTTVIALSFIYVSFFCQEHHWKSSNINISRIFCLGYSVPEVKLTLLFCYYAVNFLVYLIALIVYLYLLVGPYGSNVFIYQFCSAGGYKEQCEIYKEKAEDSYIPTNIMSTLSVILFSMINFTHLVYIVHITTVKQAVKDILKSWQCMK